MDAIQKTDHIEEIVQRGISAQHKTIEGIFEFAQCVVDLKNECTKIQGGSNFSTIAKERWGISKQAASQWLKIGNNKKLYTNGIQSKLPMSWRTIYQISNLTEDQLKLGLDERIINQEATRQDIIEFKNRLNAPKIQPKEIEVEDTLFDESNFVVKKENREILKRKEIPKVESRSREIPKVEPEVKENLRTEFYIQYDRLYDDICEKIEKDKSEIHCYRSACNYIGVALGGSTEKVIQVNKDLKMHMESRSDIALIVLRKRLQDYRPKGQEKASEVFRKLIKCKEFIK